MPADHPAERLLRPGRDRLRRGQLQAARGGLPEEGRHERREPLHGTGGVQLSSIFTRAAFALRLGDFNLLISSQITDKSRHHVRPRPGRHGAEGGALPHLRPRSLRRDQQQGHIDWIVDGYTTTSNYAYSQNADTQQVAVGSNLPGSYNYVRNSVKVVIDAYSGKMTFYDADPKDPILQAYEAAFPHMFTPISKMPADAPGAPALPAGHLLHSVGHLRALPPDQPADSSTRPATPGSCPRRPGPGRSPRPSWPRTPTTTRASWSRRLRPACRRSTRCTRCRAPHRTSRSSPSRTGSCRRRRRNLSDNNQNFNLTAWMVGLVRPGALRPARPLRDARRGRTGPANADAEISANKTVSSDITLLDQHGSEVLLGETLMVPIGNSMVYLRPLYVSPTTNPQPQLQYVVAVLGKNVQIDTSLSAVLSDLLADDRVAAVGIGRVLDAARCRRRWPAYLQQAQTDYTERAGRAQGAATWPTSRPTSSMMQQADHAGAAGDRGRRRRAPRRRPRRRRCRRPRAAKTPTKTGDDDHDHDAGLRRHDVDVHPGADEHRAEERARRPPRRRWSRRRRT